MTEGAETLKETLSWTTEPVELPGVDPAEPPTELVPGRLWQGGCPVDFRWVREAGIDVVLDLADADAYPPAAEVEGLIYVKCPLVDGGDVPDPDVTTGLARFVADLLGQGHHRALLHCTFGRNRSGLVATLVIRELLGLPGAQALAYVQERRDRAVNNEAFAQWLSTLSAPEGS